MVVTRGFRDDPHLELLEESAWHLTVELDEEQSLEHAGLVATCFGGWATVFEPPWPFGSEDDSIRATWRLLQWREAGDGAQKDRSARSLAVDEVVGLVPSRFQRWALETTEEAIQHLDALVPELAFEEGSAIVTALPELRAQLEASQQRYDELVRARDRTYGHLYVYDFPAELDLRWELQSLDDGQEVLTVDPCDDEGYRGKMVLVPPDEHIRWRWTDSELVNEAGRFLTPMEAHARAPREFQGWVASMTYRALQRARSRLADLSRGSLAEPRELHAVAQASAHAAELAAGTGAQGEAYGLAGDMPEEENVIADATSPDGRRVVIEASTWNHVVSYHPEMEAALNDVLAVVESPQLREPDPRPGRERLFGRAGPQAWLRVVIEFAGARDRLITAFPQANDPEGWERR